MRAWRPGFPGSQLAILPEQLVLLALHPDTSRMGLSKPLSRSGRTVAAAGLKSCDSPGASWVAHSMGRSEQPGQGHLEQSGGWAAPRAIFRRAPSEVFVLEDLEVRSSLTAVGAFGPCGHRCFSCSTGKVVLS